MQISPGRMVLLCIPVRTMVRMAYNTVANMEPRNMVTITGGPPWIDSVHYDIEAKSQGATGIEMMGVLLQGLLKERFSLQIHKEPRDTPVYLLTVDGHEAKLKPADSNACISRDWSDFPPPRGVSLPTFCGTASPRGTPEVKVLDSYSVDMPSFAGLLSTEVGRPVIDRTEITGRYDIHLEYARNGNSSGIAMLNGVPTSVAVPDGPPAAMSIFMELRKETGLKLTAGAAPVDVIVVDHVEQPTAN